jgi:glycosyltransferase involved in cell wall biosynthesis
VRVGYFTNQYPATSHTFIRREIRAVEALDITVLRYALRSGTDLVDLEDNHEKKQTRYILNGTGRILGSCLATIFTRPLVTGRSILWAIKIGWRSDRGILRHLAYVAEAIVLADQCRRDAVQHLHAHFGTNSAVIAMLATQFCEIPYSFTAHGPEEFVMWPNPGLREAIRRCAFVVGISSYACSQLYWYSEHECWHKVHVVHCGLESSVFAGGNNPPAAERRLACVGRLSPQKGHLLLVEATRLLAAQGEDFELVLVGDGPLRPEIEKMIRCYKLQARVRITGWVDDRNVRQEILAARALVQPSFAEGLPVVIMEAMALGRPIISTFVAGIPELVRAGESGWLVAAGDVEALAGAMRACLRTSVESLAPMGDAAQRRVLSRHNVETEALKLVGLFKHAIAQRSEY